MQLAAAEQPVHDAPEFAGQVKQSVTADAAVFVEYVPDPQSVHAAEPVATLYFPATHAMHAPPSGPVKPTLQVQLAAVEQPVHDAPELAVQARHAAAAVAPAVAEYFAAAQSVHAAEPVATLYFPATHAAHGPPLGPVYPALQSATIQAALDVLATGDVEPAGHAVHVAVPVVSL